MAIASTTSDNDADDMGRQNVVARKGNPVTLVNTVVARKSAVQPPSVFGREHAEQSDEPVKIPTRLSTT